MADINLSKSDIPFWFSGTGTLNVHVGVADPTQPLPASDEDLLSVGFNASGSQPISIGKSDTFKFGISAEANASLTPLWQSSSADRLKKLDDYGLTGYFNAGANHDDRVLIILNLGASADASVEAKFKYWNLSASALLEAGADGSYTLIRSFPSNMAAGELVRQFFRGFRLPANVDAPLAADELISFEYGGYVNFKGSVGLGYELSGAPSFGIGDLQLSEKYKVSLMASLGLESRIAGQFKIEVRQGSEDGWARVVLSKSRSKFFAIAADVAVGADFEQEGLPESADDFLGAVLGLKAQNWLNLFQQAKDLTDFQKLQEYTDKLAESFIEKYTGKAFDTLVDNAQFKEAMDLVKKVIDEYNGVGDKAVELFDKYYDAASGALDSKLTEALDFIKGLASLDQLKGQVDSTVWDVVERLTDGDPLGWLLGKVDIGGVSVDSLDELKQRVDKVIALVQDGAHKEIRDLIALAKSQFPLDKFISELQGLDLMKLKALADRRLIGFVERLLGEVIDKTSNSKVGQAVTRFNQALVAIDKFKNTLYEKMKEALTQSFSFKLHAAYSRASETDALLDFEIDLTSALGKDLMQKAGQGDFADVLAAYDSGSVKLNEGVLSHKVTKESSLSVNIVGWHLGWNYQALDRLIVEAEQRIVPQEGQLTVITNMSMQKERERKRNGERVYTNLLLRFIGESRGVLDFDKSNQTYLVDAITHFAGSYELVFQDPSTTPNELAQYLSFADDFGLASSDQAAVDAITPFLPTDAQGNYGATSVTYDVRFTENGLQSLFTKPFGPMDEVFLRRTMRLLVLASYVNEGAALADRAWCYWTPQAHAEWAVLGPATFANATARAFGPPPPSPFKNLEAPKKRITLPKVQLGQLSTLISIENSLVEGMRKLSGLVQSQQKLSPRDFEKALDDFGSALTEYDNIDKGENTVFALFDRLIKRDSAGQPYRNSSLEIKSEAAGKEVTKMLVA
ncbi:MAG TPA: hypothetical protein VN256_01650 [Pyrinomonadaceae bacterium]|nr:hypothetical protein [Pyrinomonadaceae bacterium]